MYFTDDEPIRKVIIPSLNIWITLIYESASNNNRNRIGVYQQTDISYIHEIRNLWNIFGFIRYLLYFSSLSDFSKLDFGNLYSNFVITLLYFCCFESIQFHMSATIMTNLRIYISSSLVLLNYFYIRLLLLTYANPLKSIRLI